MSAAALFEGVRSALATGSDKLGPVQLTNSEAARGVITGLVTLAGAARPAALEVSVTTLPSGTPQVSLTNRLPPAMFVNSRQWADSACAFLATVSGPAGAAQPASRAGGGAGPANPARTGGATTEAQAATAGLAYREVLSGTLAQAEEIDRFRLRGAAPGDTIQVWSRDPREPEPKSLGQWYHGGLKESVRDQGAARTLPEIPGGRIVLQGTGPFEIRVESDSPALPYLIQVAKISNQPEHLGARVTAGDTIRGEAIDYPRDTDEFSFAGRAGEEIQVYLGDHRSLTYSVIRRRPGARDEQLPRGSAGIIRLPASGTYILSVGVAFLTTEYNMMEPYWFRIRRRD